MEHVTTPGQIIFVFVLFMGFCVVAGLWLRSGIAQDSAPVDFDPAGIVGHALLALLHWRPLPVNRFDDDAASVMSRSEQTEAPSMPSSLETRPDQTALLPTDPALRRAKLLDTYRPLRKAGMSREAAQALLHAWGIPLDNNLWRDAAPPPAPHVTPIAGRPTEASFDPELAYCPPE
jgi:hypothetical protein